MLLLRIAAVLALAPWITSCVQARSPMIAPTASATYRSDAIGASADAAIEHMLSDIEAETVRRAEATRVSRPKWNGHSRAGQATETTVLKADIQPGREISRSVTPT